MHWQFYTVTKLIQNFKVALYFSNSVLRPKLSVVESTKLHVLHVY